MSDDVEKARKKVQKEFESVRKNLGNIHMAFDAIRTAGPEDDIYELLGTLEKATKEARTGGLVGSGAKSHHKALNNYRALRDAPVPAETERDE